MLTLCHNYFQVINNCKSNKDATQQISKRKYAFGVFILLTVAILWVVSSELTRYIYIEKKLERPFLVTYVRSSLLIVYLLVLCFTPPTRDPCRPADYTQLLEPVAETDDENYFTESTNSLGDSTFVPVRAGETTDSDDAAPRAVRFNKVAEVRVMSAAMAGEALLARLSWAASVRATEYAQRRAAAAATRRHLKLAMLFCVPWFISNYLYRLSILYRSTSSACVYTTTYMPCDKHAMQTNLWLTINIWFISNYLYRLSILYTSTSSACVYTWSAGALALSLGAASAQSPQDHFTLTKCVAVLLTAGSLVVLGISESHESNWIAVLAALGSAVCYAIHLVLFRQELRKGDGINAPLLVGLVGCACGCIAWMVGGALAAAGLEVAELPSPRLWSWLLLDAALGPLTLETLWLLGKSLTGDCTASGIAALALPLAAVAQAWRGLPASASASAPATAAAAALATAGWAAALLDPPALRRHPAAAWLAARLAAGDGFSAIRSISELDEQSEALMSSDEPT